MHWSRRRTKKKMDCHFYRQNPIGHCIVDFSAPKANLVVQEDGLQHTQIESRKKHNGQDGNASRKSNENPRLNAHEVVSEIDTVAQRIYEVVKKGPR